MITATTKGIQDLDEKYSYGPWLYLHCTDCPEWTLIAGPFLTTDQLGDKVEAHENSHKEKDADSSRYRQVAGDDHGGPVPRGMEAEGE
jgi:hypothetical protein